MNEPSFGWLTAEVTQTWMMDARRYGGKGASSAPHPLEFGKNDDIRNTIADTEIDTHKTQYFVCLRYRLIFDAKINRLGLIKSAIKS